MWCFIVRWQVYIELTDMYFYFTDIMNFGRCGTQIKFLERRAEMVSDGI